MLFVVLLEGRGDGKVETFVSFKIRDRTLDQGSRAADVIMLAMLVILISMNTLTNMPSMAIYL